AIAVIEVPVPRLRVGFVGGRTILVDVHIITLAMRPCVISADGHTASNTALEGKKHAVIFLHASIVELRQMSDLVSVTRPLETQETARVGICRCGARGILHSVERALSEPEEHSGIDRVLSPYVERPGSDIACRCQPVGPKLPLKREIPRVNVQRLHIRLLGEKQSTRRKRRILVQDVRERTSTVVSPWSIQSTAGLGERRAAAP